MNSNKVSEMNQTMQGLNEKSLPTENQSSNNRRDQRLELLNVSNLLTYKEELILHF